MKKAISIILSILFVFSLVVPAVAEGSIQCEVAISYAHSYIDSADGVIIEVLIFFLGILVGYVIDGIFTYATGGQSIAQFTATQIQRIVRYVRTHLGITEVFVSSSGAIWSGSSGKY
ncbi:MAG: hypothetical protein IKZ82_01165 [Clostridia bacterium]|nr:hypothetical protein [Clostridia bacterium]